MRISVSVTPRSCVVLFALFLNSCNLIPALAPSFLQKYDGLSGLKIEDSETVEVVILELPKPVLHPVAGFWIHFTLAKFPDGKIHRIIVWPDEDLKVGDTLKIRAIYGQERMVNKGERDYLGKK